MPRSNTVPENGIGWRRGPPEGPRLVSVNPGRQEIFESGVARLSERRPQLSLVWNPHEAREDASMGGESLRAAEAPPGRQGAMEDAAQQAKAELQAALERGETLPSQRFFPPEIDIGQTLLRLHEFLDTASDEELLALWEETER